MKILRLILLILLISFVSAQSIEVDYPKEVYVNEEFSFKIILSDFDSGTYDVKIDIFGEETRVSRILDNNDWKSTFYYVNNAISANEEKEFVLKIENYVGPAYIEIKIRKSKTTIVKTFSDYSLESIQKTDSSQESTENTGELESGASNISEENVEASGSLDRLNSATGEVIGNEIVPIILNPKNIKSEENSEKLKRNYPLYGLIAFSILLAILFWVRKKGNKNEF